MSKDKSRSCHDVAHLNPLTNVPTKHQFPIPYSFQDIVRTRLYRSRSLWEGQRSNQGHTMTLHTYTPKQCPYQVSTSYTLRFPRYSPDKIFKLKVTLARSKVKSRSHHDVAHLQPLTNVPTKYQLPTPYSFQDIVRTRLYRSRSLWEGQRSNQGHTMTLHTYTPKQCPYQVSTSYTLRFPRYSPDKIFKLKVTLARSKVKSRSHHDVAHLQPLTNVPTKYQLPTPYSFQDIVRTRLYRSRSLWEGQRSNQGHTMTLHTYTPKQCPYQVSTSYTLRFPRYSPDKIFKLKVTLARSKVKSRSHHDVAHLQPLTNVPTKYQLPTPYGF